MSYKPIHTDQTARTIMGVSFHDARAFDDALQAIGSNMFEGFEPTPQGIAIIRDYLAGAISIHQLIHLTRQNAYAKRI